MADRSLSVDILYVLGDIVVGLLVVLILAVPLAVPALVWWLRR